MTRPRKCRRVAFVPENSCFKPQLASSEEVVLNIEEVEALRLSDFLEMEQDKAAENMNVSRGTFQRILNSARKKTADALVHGKTIHISGGDYRVAMARSCCKRQSGLCKRRGCEKCDECEEINNIYEVNRYE